MKKLLLSILSLSSLAAFPQWTSTPIFSTGSDCIYAFGKLFTTSANSSALDVSTDEGGTFSSSNTGIPAGGVNFGTYNSSTASLLVYKNNNTYQSSTGSSWTTLPAGSIGGTDYVKSMTVGSGTTIASTSPLSGLGFKIHHLNGTTWTQKSSTTNTIVSCLRYLNGTLWAGTTSYGLLRSPDYGVTFMTAPGTPTNLVFDKYILCMAATNTVLLCGTQGGKICRSIDNGTTWNAVYNIGNGSNTVYVSDIYVMTNNTILVACDSGFVYNTSNGTPGTWVKDNAGLTKTAGTYQVNHVAVTPNYIILSDRNGMVMRRAISQLAIGIKEIATTIFPSKVFPNPASGSAAIEASDLIYEDNCEVRLSDVLGREVGVFEMTQGKCNIDLSNFNKGLYTYSVYANKTIASMGKLVVN